MATHEVGNVDPYTFLYLSNRSMLEGPDEKQSVVVDEEEKGFSVCSYLEWFFVAAISVGLAVTLGKNSLRHKVVWGSGLWKWELSLLLLIGSRLASGTVVRVIVCLLHILFRSSNRFIYVVHKVQHTVKKSLMAWLVVAAWGILFGELEIALQNQALIAIDKILINYCGILMSLWVVKSVFVMSFAAWFRMRTVAELLH